MTPYIPSPIPSTPLGQARFSISAASSTSDLNGGHSYDAGSSSFDYGPQDEYGDDTSFSVNGRRLSHASPMPSGSSPKVGGRTRARAHSIGFGALGSPATAGGGEDGRVFGDDAYSYALRPEEEDEEENEDDEATYEMSNVGRGGAAGRASSSSQNAARKEYLRDSFQSLTGQEWAWMGATAVVVLVFSSAAVILAALG